MQIKRTLIRECCLWEWRHLQDSKFNIDKILPCCNLKCCSHPFNSALVPSKERNHTTYPVLELLSYLRIHSYSPIPTWRVTTPAVIDFLTRDYTTHLYTEMISKSFWRIRISTLYTPPKTSMELDNTFLEKKKHLPTTYFWLPPYFSGVYWGVPPFFCTRCCTTSIW